MNDWCIALLSVASLIYVIIAFFFALAFFGEESLGSPPGRFRKSARQQLGCCVLAIIASIVWPVPAVLYLAIAGAMALIDKYLCTSGHTCGMSLSRQDGLSSGALQAEQNQLHSPLTLLFSTSMLPPAARAPEELPLPLPIPQAVPNTDTTIVWIQLRETNVPPTAQAGQPAQHGGRAEPRAAHDSPDKRDFRSSTGV